MSDDVNQFSTSDDHGSPTSPHPEDGGSLLGEGLLERSFECGRLERAVDAAALCSGSLVLVEGEAGVGKSSLIHAVGGEAAWRGFAWLAARGRELERDVPFGVARELVSPLLGGADRGRGRGRGNYAERVSRLLSPGRRAPRPGADRRPEIIEVLVALVDQLMTGDEDPSRPVLITVDDAHWADDSSLRFLGHLADRAERRPLVVVVGLRPETAEESGRDLGWLRNRPGAQVLRPAPLTEAAVEQLVRERFPRCRPKFWAACAEVSGGNPFLLLELLSALAEDAAEGTDDDAEVARTLVPDAVLRSTLARLGRLEPETVALAAAVAILGEASLRQAAALADLEPHRAEEAADALARVRILRPDEPLRFVHPLVASAVYSDLAPFTRARAHRQAAELLAESGAAAERVGGHVQATRPEGDPWVVEWLRRAAAGALVSGEPSSAVRFLSRALAEPPAAAVRADVLLELAEAEARAGAHGAVVHLDEALNLLDEPHRRVGAALELAGLLFARLDLPAAAEIARRGLAEPVAAPAVADALLAIELTVASLSSQRAAAVQRVTALLRDVLSGDTARSPELLTLMAVSASCAGEAPPVVLELAQRAQAASPADQAIAELFMLMFLPQALLQVDAFEEIERLVERSLASAQREGRVLAAALARQWHAYVLYHQGQLRAAEAQAESALAVRAHGWEAPTDQTAAILAHTRLDLGEHEAANNAIRTAEGASDAPMQPMLLHARGRLALAEGDPAAALRDFESAGRYIQSFGISNPAVLPWRSASALAAHALGERERAATLVEQEIADARRIGVNRPLGVALCAAGVIAEPRRSIALLTDAVSVLDQSPAQLEHTRALVELGAALRRGGRPVEAREPLSRALEWAEDRGATPLAQRARDELHATGARPRRGARAGPQALTPTERRIAELAAHGRTNREIAAELTITPKTVEWHLTHAYRKLGVTTRQDLRRRLRDNGDTHETSPTWPAGRSP